LFLYGILIGLIIGKIRKGKFEKFGYLTIEYPALVIVGLLMQIMVFMLNLGLSDLGETITKGILISSYGFLIFAIFLNRRIRFLVIVFLGTLFNFVAMAMNDFSVGVTMKAAEKAFDPDIVDLIVSGHVKYFTIIPESQFYRGAFLACRQWSLYPTVITLGDLIIALGMILVIQNIMTDKSIRKGTNIRYSKKLFR